MSEGGGKKKLKIEHVANGVISYYLRTKKNSYRLYEIAPGLIVPISINKKDVSLVEEMSFLTELRSDCIQLAESFRSIFYGDEICFLTKSNAKTIFNTMVLEKKLRETSVIKSFAFKSDDTLTFCRIPFDLAETELPTAKWDTFLNNFTNVSAMKAWIGSLFIDGSDRSQYLWIYGKGGNGKSTLAKVISAVLGNFVRFEQAPARDDKYWTFGLLGKRLVVIDDCNNYGFVKTGLFKSLTGSSKVRIEQKFSDPKDAELNCKFLFTSNEKPMVSSELADQRRLIFVSSKNQDAFTYDKEFIAGLKNELPNFISNCVLLFKAHCADGNPIPSDQTESLELGGIFDEEIEAWIDSHFEYAPDSIIEVSNFRAQMDLKPGQKLDGRRVYAYLEKKNVTRLTKWIDGRAVKCISGLKQKIVRMASF